MSITQKIMETVVQFIPDKEVDPLIRQKHGHVGKPFSRVDGKLKVKGEAKFSAEFKFDNLAYAAFHYSTIAKGVITKIESSEAEKSPGVIAVITHENAPKLGTQTAITARGERFAGFPRRGDSLERTASGGRRRRNTGSGGSGGESRRSRIRRGNGGTVL